jgi:hypothetical protein
LLFRNPQAVALIKEHILELWDVATKEMEAHYPEHRLPTDPPTFEEYRALIHPAAPQKGASDFLQTIIDNDKVGPTIFNMHWSRVQLQKSRLPLLTSDRPLHMPIGLAQKDAYIALPIGPYSVFLAAYDDRLARSVGQSKHTDMVRKLNRQTVGQARQFVWGIDDSQLNLVKRRICSIAERPILTEAQRREALTAVPTS